MRKACEILSMKLTFAQGAHKLNINYNGMIKC